jgi:GDPmannose 4,6-dehydratase
MTIQALFMVQKHAHLHDRQHTLIGNPEKARKELGWQREVSFDTLVQMMMEADLQRVAGGARR